MRISFQRILFFILFFVGANAQAAPTWGPKKIAVVIGGAGDPRDLDTTIFDNDFAKLSRVLIHRGYETYSVFGGANKKINELAKRYHKNHWPASVENYDLVVDLIGKRLANKEIKAGDQIAIFILGHGDNRNKDSDRQAHPVVMLTEDLKSETIFNLDQLRRIINFAEDKDVKVAVIDASCYSGHSLELASDKTCVLVSSTSKTLGYHNFIDELMNVAYFDLEQMYLMSRKHVEISQPEISTEAHKKTRKEFWFLENYIMFNLFKIFYLYPRRPWEPCFCEKDLFNFIGSYTEKFVPTDPEKRWINNLEDWNQFRSLAKDIRERLEWTIELQKKVTPKTEMTFEMKGEKAVLTNHALYFFVQYQDPRTKAYFKTLMYKGGIKMDPKEFWDLVAKEAPRIKASDEYKEYIRYREIQTQLDALFGRLSLLERKVYDDYYRKVMKPNVCSEFQF